MEINCKQIVESYLLNKNPLYAFRFPLSILIAIIFFGLSKAYEWSNNSYINQILIPILAFLVSMVLFDIIARLMISKNEIIRLEQLCKLWMHDPYVKKHPILSKMVDMDAVSKYNIESFTINDNTYNFNIDNINKKEIIENKTSEENNDNIRNIVRNKILDERKNISIENIEIPIYEIKNISPSSIEFKKDNAKCIEKSGSCNLCSGENSNPYNLISPIPGPQWLPQTAESVQNRLKNNDYTFSSCVPLLSNSP